MTKTKHKNLAWSAKDALLTARIEHGADGRPLGFVRAHLASVPDVSPDELLGRLSMEISHLESKAAMEGMSLAVRIDLSSTMNPLLRDPLENLMSVLSSVRFYGQTALTLDERGAWPENYHLVHIMTVRNTALCAVYLAAGRSVRVLVPNQGSKVAWFALGEKDVPVVDGDVHDLRFLDPAGALVMQLPVGPLQSPHPAAVKSLQSAGKMSS